MREEGPVGVEETPKSGQACSVSLGFPLDPVFAIPRSATALGVLPQSLQPR